eukprot:TRINITY_DN8268_c0_g1_i3.p1 TRINITY_DN8268_c0_g1~~TRINITY_DN8268_c0_g1_i3.p1  ORF type:complete len:209 (+),score=21.06 TRINITY_DN8268_c0_g1_i3:275-901(+)
MAQSQTLSKQLQSKQSEPFQAFVGLEDRQSNLAPALLAVAGLKGSDIKGEILTKPFLDICRPIVNVLDHLGSTMAVIRADVSGNIQRLDELNQTGKAEYRVLFEIVREEAAANTAKRPLSCSKAILWLTRSLDFTLSLFRKLLDHPDWTLKTAVEESYCETLKPWHGWISVAASKVTLQQRSGKIWRGSFLPCLLFWRKSIALCEALN